MFGMLLQKKSSFPNLSFSLSLTLFLSFSLSLSRSLNIDKEIHSCLWLNVIASDCVLWCTWFLLWVLGDTASILPLRCITGYLRTCCARMNLKKFFFRKKNRIWRLCRYNQCLQLIEIYFLCVHHVHSYYLYKYHGFISLQLYK